MQARRENLREEAVYMNHAFSGGPLLKDAAVQEQARSRDRYDALKDRHQGWWNN